MSLLKKIHCTMREYWTVILAPMLLLAPLVLRGHVVFWGTPALQFIPWWAYAWESLRQGFLPLWNPLNGLGAPLIANYQLAFFYPPNWLILLFAAAGGAAGVAVGFTVLSVFHLAWAGLGMAFLLKRLQFSWLAQVLGGLAFGLSGYIVGRLGFLSMPWVAAWLPWVIIFADRIAAPSQTRRPVVSIGLSLSLGMQLLAGHAQLTWYTILLSGLWVTGISWRQGKKKVIQSLGTLAVSGLLSAGLAAVQLIPTGEYLLQSHRAEAVAYEDAMMYSFWPWRILTLFAPDFFGSPAQGDYWGYASYWEDNAYFGILPLLLALATLWLLVRSIWTKDRTQRWYLLAGLWALTGTAFIFAFGKYLPVFPLLYRHVPSFDMFQAPARYLIWAAFAFPLLAAVGVERWRCPTGRGLYWFRLATAGAFAVTLGAALGSVVLMDVQVTFIRATALAGMWAMGFGLLTLLIPYVEKRGYLRFWQWAVIAWTLSDLLLAGWSLNPGAPASIFSFQSAAANEIKSDAGSQRVFLDRVEEYDLKFLRFFRFKDFSPLEDWLALRETLIPNLNMLDGVLLVRNFDPLVPDSYARWMAGIDQMDVERQKSWLALLGVGLIEHIDGSRPYGVRFDPLPEGKRLHWYTCSRLVGGEQVWTALAEEWMVARQSSRMVLIETGSGEEFSSKCQGGSADFAIVSERPMEVIVRVDAAETGWLVLADTWYPGWRAEVDGEPVSIARADGLFRAVKIMAGYHEVTFYYAPFGFYIGAILSILVTLFIAFLWTFQGRRPEGSRSLS